MRERQCCTTTPVVHLRRNCFGCQWALAGELIGSGQIEERDRGSAVPSPATHPSVVPRSSQNSARVHVLATFYAVLSRLSCFFFRVSIDLMVFTRNSGASPFATNASTTLNTNSGTSA